MKKLLLSVAAMAATAFMAVSPAFATYAAQIEQGDIYWAKNVTKGGSFVDPASATCGDTVQFRVRIHNLGPDVATSVNVKATLPGVAATSHSSTMTITPVNGQPASISDTAGVNLDKVGKLAYVAGSTELLDANGAKMSTLGETIFTSGVNIGDVNISIQNKRFVQFSAKVECPTPPPVKITVCDLTTNKVVSINESDFDSKKHTKDLTQCDKIRVCELSSKNIVTIYRSQYDAAKHSTDLSKCTPSEPVKIKVCVIATKEIVTIKEEDFDSSKHTKDLNKCAPAEPGSIKVCVTATKEIVTIKENEFDSAKHAKDLNTCAKTETVVMPTELPKTGMTGGVLALLASLVAGGSVYAVRAIRASKLG